MDIPTRFDAKEAEPRIYKMWEAEGAFTANPGSKRPPFTIVIPPPNVTGALHLGHALNNTLQDILTRWRRMDGHEALYLPGTDHAGIATQAKVEKMIQETEQKSRHDLGREAFLERVWAWKEKYGNTILMQLRRLGCSCDWSRTRFTMDEAYSRAVKQSFVALFKKGFIYRGQYVINWCPRCRTALSDLEVRKEEKAGKLWHIRYPFKGGGGHVTVATTRPETMLGDVAVAVHPDDARYRGLAGRTLVLPLMNREIPLIADSFVDPKFGSGAVKITPAHDVSDFECARRHTLNAIDVIEADATMSANAGAYAGLDRFAARKRVVADLEGQGLIEKIEDYAAASVQCARCDTILEPRLSEQWFCRMRGLAAPAIEAVKSGEIRFVPERWAKVYLDWMENIRDWCISRQLWWGHQIPVFYCACGEAVAAVDPPATCPKCGKGPLKQDEDVLDTWFSSALWPFATLGWPAETEDLEKFYPTSVLVTSRDIINLWVARMIMTGFEFRGEKPFGQVLIHATLMDDEGKRQSKSKGTGIDPLVLIDEYGADALRFALAWLTTGTQDIRFGSEMSGERVAMARNFVTKLWNAARFTALNAADAAPGAPDAKELGAAERWILSRLNTTSESVSESLEAFEFGPAAQSLYAFVWDDFCSWYIELTKGRLEEPAVKRTLAHVLDASLRLLHPFCPFVTEEIWQRLRERGAEKEEMLIRAAWPEEERGRRDEPLERGMALVFEAVRAVREARTEFKVPPAEALDAAVSMQDEAAAALVRGLGDRVRQLAGLRELEIGVNLEKPKSPSVRPCVSGHLRVFVELGTRFDRDAEIRKKEKERTEASSQADRIERQLANEAFRKAKPELAAEQEAKLTALRRKLEEIESALKELKA